MRFATTEQESDTVVSVVLQEIIKLALSLLLYLYEMDMNFEMWVHGLYSNTVERYSTVLKLSVPAVLYFLQNCSLQLASANLPTAVFQSATQSKTVAVALCSVIMLKVVLSKTKWISILTLSVGLVLVQFGSTDEVVHTHTQNHLHQNHTMGVLFALTASMCSGIASVYFEKLLKQPNGAGDGRPCSIWVRNIQLAGWSVVVGYIQLICANKPVWITKWHLTKAAWVMVLYNAVGGLLVAMVIKHADNIAKGFTTAVATVMTMLLSIVLFHYTINIAFVCGILFVVFSTLLYNGTIELSTLLKNVRHSDEYETLRTLSTDCIPNNGTVVI